ncbi:hypothetical protein P152DRAFT_490431, partial [Eremomyces bilateralis CBS 781.70]
PDESKVPLLLGVTTSLFSFSLIVYGARVYTRVHPVLNIRWDDYAMFTAVVLAIGQYAVIVNCIHNGTGRHAVYLTPETIILALRAVWIQQLFWTWSITFIKVSVALMLMRIRNDKPWRIWLPLLISFLICSAASSTVLQFIQCTPVRTFWDRTTLGASAGRQKTYSFLCTSTIAVFISTDVTLSLLPLTFITKLRRPLRERVAIMSHGSGAVRHHRRDGQNVSYQALREQHRPALGHGRSRTLGLRGAVLGNHCGLRAVSEGAV